MAPRRGIIYDRNMRELAMTVLVDSIYADPSEIADKPAAARTLAAIVHTDPEDALTSRDADCLRVSTPDATLPGLRAALLPSRRRCQSPQHEGHLFSEGIPALLP